MLTFNLLVFSNPLLYIFKQSTFPKYASLMIHINAILLISFKECSGQ